MAQSRWAAARGLTEMEGHAAGVEGIREIIRHAVRRGIDVLSLYAFSRENWARSDEEVSGLFIAARAGYSQRDRRTQVPGSACSSARPDGGASSRDSSVDPGCAGRDGGGERLQLNIAFNYSGRTELVDAARKVVEMGLRPDEIDEDVMAAAMYTAGLPDPDMVIRTGGDERLSNFLIWQSAYAEIVFTPTLWPDFGPAELDAAIVEFASRQRRFGR